MKKAVSPKIWTVTKRARKAAKRANKKTCRNTTSVQRHVSR